MLRLTTLLALGGRGLFAHAGVLDFDYTTTPLGTADIAGTGPLLPVGSTGWISQRDGDVTGVVDVSYRYIASSASPVPEPGSWALLAAGLAATAALHHRRRRC